MHTYQTCFFLICKYLYAITKKLVYLYKIQLQIRERAKKGKLKYEKIHF